MSVINATQAFMLLLESRNGHKYTWKDDFVARTCKRRPGHFNPRSSEGGFELEVQGKAASCKFCDEALLFQMMVILPC